MKPRQRLWTFLVTLVVALGIGAVAVSPASAFTGAFNGAYQIRAGTTTKCLDVTGDSPYNGTYLQLYDCLGAGQTNQLFYIDLIPALGYYQIKSASSLKCLDVEGVSLNPGARVQQYDCLGASQANQVFYVNPSGSSYSIVPTHSWQYITYQGLFNGATIFQWPTSSPVYWSIVRP